MKKFSQFIQEANNSLSEFVDKNKNLAVFNAKRVRLPSGGSLVPDGHGGWKDSKTGEYVADSELTNSGVTKLKFFNQSDKEIIGKRDRNQDRTKFSPLVPPSHQVKEEISVVFGRFNPPTLGHQRLFDTLSEVAEHNDYRIYPSRSNDPKKNPLDPATKISVMREMYPDHSDKIVDDNNIRNILDVLKNLCEEGYSKVNIVVGSDRQNEFEKLTNQYNNDLYFFEEINVVSAGDRDPDSDDVEGISASKLRKFVIEGNYQEFSKGIPCTFNSTKSQKLYKVLRQSMNIEEGYELWEVSPKCDIKNLRENYLAEKIYKIGEWVENLNTGLVGKIIRRGTNYLICVSEDNVMFKPWIRDVVEVFVKEVPDKNLKKLVKKAVNRQDMNIDGFVDKGDKSVGPYGAFIPQSKNVPANFKIKEWTDKSGVPANQREVGTDALRKYVMSLTDTKQINNFDVKKFINKYKVKRT
jgi:nicotinic acid mononucleotide adenylyltransferase